jgi:hypothetical protein
MCEILVQHKHDINVKINGIDIEKFNLENIFKL